MKWKILYRGGSDIFSLHTMRYDVYGGWQTFLKGPEGKRFRLSAHMASAGTTEFHCKAKAAIDNILN